MSHIKNIHILVDKGCSFYEIQGFINKSTNTAYYRESSKTLSRKEAEAIFYLHMSEVYPKVMVHKQSS